MLSSSYLHISQCQAQLFVSPWEALLVLTTALPRIPAQDMIQILKHCDPVTFNLVRLFKNTTKAALFKIMSTAFGIRMNTMLPTLNRKELYDSFRSEYIRLGHCKPGHDEEDEDNASDEGEEEEVNEEDNIEKVAKGKGQAKKTPKAKAKAKAKVSGQNKAIYLFCGCLFNLFVKMQ